MSDSFRRFDILLPQRFNDGRPVPDELIADTLLEFEVGRSADQQALWQSRAATRYWTTNSVMALFPALFPAQ
jgi:hypothetical protein